MTDKFMHADPGWRVVFLDDHQTGKWSAYPVIAWKTSDGPRPLTPIACVRSASRVPECVDDLWEDYLGVFGPGETDERIIEELIAYCKDNYNMSTLHFLAQAADPEKV